MKDLIVNLRRRDSRLQSVTVTVDRRKIAPRTFTNFVVISTKSSGRVLLEVDAKSDDQTVVRRLHTRAINTLNKQGFQVAYKELAAA